MNLALWRTAWEGLGAWTWETSLHASVVISLVLGLQMLLGGRLPVRARCWLSLLVVVRLVMPVVPATT